MKIKLLKALLSLSAMAVGVTVGFGIVNHAIAEKATEVAASLKMTKSEYRINRNGKTFGSLESIENAPDLILTKGVHGITGYVKYEDFLGHSPEVSKKAAAQDDFVRIPLYAEDGNTVIDEHVLLPQGDPNEHRFCFVIGENANPGYIRIDETEKMEREMYRDLKKGGKLDDSERTIKMEVLGYDKKTVVDTYTVSLTMTEAEFIQNFEKVGENASLVQIVTKELEAVQ